MVCFELRENVHFTYLQTIELSSSLVKVNCIVFDTYEPRAHVLSLSIIAFTKKKKNSDKTFFRCNFFTNSHKTLYFLSLHRVKVKTRNVTFVLVVLAREFYCQLQTDTR